MRFIISILTLSSLIITGCAGKPPAAANVTKVTVAIYDVTPRTASTELTVYQTAEAVTRPYRSIALINALDKTQAEAQVLDAICARARELGAQGLIVLPPQQPYRGWPASATDQNLRNFRAEAIVFTNK